MESRSIDERGAILDLERRIVHLERSLYGHSLPVCGVATLVRFYLDAHQIIRHIEPDSAGAWVVSAYLWDVRTLVLLGRQVNDPFPFRPFLAAVDICVLRGIPGAEEARAHLLSVSQDLLTAEGLELLEPRDVMGQLRLGEALTRIG